MAIFFRRYKSRLNLGEKEIKKTLKRRLTWIVGILVAHALAFWAFEPVSFRDALWVTITTLTTVGYGDISATTVFGQISTALLCFMVGIPILASVWDAYASWRDDVRDQMRSGRFNWDLKDHILIANFPKEYSIEQMVRLIKAIRSQASLANKPIQLLTRRFEGSHLPQELLDLGNIAHVNGLASRTRTLELGTAEEASHVVILRDGSDNDPEGHNFNVCSRIREVNPHARIVIQVDDPYSRAAQRLHRAGATSLLRPVRAYPEIIALSMITDGVNDLFEDLLSIDGNEFRLIPYQGVVEWKTILHRASEEDYGIPIGVHKRITDEDGKHHFEAELCPSLDFKDYAEGIYVISRKKNGTSYTNKDWQTLLNSPSDAQVEPCPHLCIMNLPVNKVAKTYYLDNLLYQLRSTSRYRDSKITIISEVIPDRFYEKAHISRSSDPSTGDAWIWKNVSLVKAVPSESLMRSIETNSFLSDFNEESVVAILNNDGDNDPDGYTFELIDILRAEGNYQGTIFAEADDDNERKRLYKTGADYCLRPIRGYPGMLARSLTSPGVEKAVEALFKMNQVSITRSRVGALESAHVLNASFTLGDLMHLSGFRDGSRIPLAIGEKEAKEDCVCPSKTSAFRTLTTRVLMIERK